MEDRIEKIERSLFGEPPSSVGLVYRMDRIERIGFRLLFGIFVASAAGGSLGSIIIDAMRGM